jgi:hypothetical protein
MKKKFVIWLFLDPLIVVQFYLEVNIAASFTLSSVLLLLNSEVFYVPMPTGTQDLDF